MSRSSAVSFSLGFVLSFFLFLFLFPFRDPDRWLSVACSTKRRIKEGTTTLVLRVDRLSKLESRVKTRSDDERTVEEGGARPQEIPVVSEEACAEVLKKRVGG